MSEYAKLAYMMVWYRSFHGEYPRTICITQALWRELRKQRPELKRYKKVLGAKLAVMPDKIVGKSCTGMIVDDVEHDLDVRAPWSP